MEGTYYDIPYKNLYFFVATAPNQVGIFGKMQMISYSFIISKHVQINSQFWEAIDAKSLIVLIFGGQVVEKVRHLTSTPSSPV